jgi:hypothetical protein
MLSPVRIWVSPLSLYVDLQVKLEMERSPTIVALSELPRKSRGYDRYGIFKEGESESHEMIVGYSPPDEDRIDRSIRPRFETTPLYAPGPLQEIVGRYDEIRKIVKSYTLTLPLGDNRSRIERALDLIMAKPVAASRRGEHDETDRRMFRVETTWQPSREALIREIEEWETQDYADNYWVGVYFEGDNKIHRFDKEQGKMSIDLNGDLEDRPLWTGEDLVQAWRAARDRVEDFLRSVESEQDVS